MFFEIHVFRYNIKLYRKTIINFLYKYNVFENNYTLHANNFLPKYHCVTKLLDRAWYNNRP
jgi:hypothetical protein